MRVPKILAVEDSEITQETLKEIFSQLGCEITLVLSAEKAVEKLKQNSKPDVIILDLKLPGKSGVDLYKDIVMDPEWREIPVVPFTSQWNDYLPHGGKLAMDWLYTAHWYPKMFDKNHKDDNLKAISKGSQGEHVSTVPQELVLTVANTLIQHRIDLPLIFKETVDLIEQSYLKQER
jgi:CheY-like chemotaxis protein